MISDFEKVTQRKEAKNIAEKAQKKKEYFPEHLYCRPNGSVKFQIRCRRRMAHDYDYDCLSSILGCLHEIGRLSRAYTRLKLGLAPSSSIRHFLLHHDNEFFVDLLRFSCRGPSSSYYPCVGALSLSSSPPQSSSTRQRNQRDAIIITNKLSGTVHLCVFWHANPFVFSQPVPIASLPHSHLFQCQRFRNVASHSLRVQLIPE